MIALALSAALAQTAPETSVQLWRLPVDAERTLWTEDASPAPEGWASGRVALSYLRDPLVYQWDDGSIDGVLRNAIALDLAGGYTRGPLRFGATLPLWLLAAGDRVDGGGGLGDITAEVRGIALDQRTAPIGLAGTARVMLPTATLRAPLANRGFAFEAVAITDVNAGPARLSGNVGVRLQPKAEVDDDGTLDDHLFARVGAGLPIDDDVGLSLDLGGQLNLAGQAVEGLPLEAIVGGWLRSGDFVVRGGIGAGLTAAIGAPTLRALVVVGYEPERVWDRDHDGFSDEVDGCPEEPEDVDGWRDQDGCPDPLTEVHVRVVDHGGIPVPGGVLSLQGSDHPVADTFVVELEPGAYPVRADGTEHQPADALLTVVAGTPQDFLVVLEHDMGTLHLVVTDPSGGGITSVAHLPNLPDTALPSGTADFTLLPGIYQLSLDAPGYLPTTFPVEIIGNETVPFTIILQPRKVQVTRERLVITDKVYFDYNKATIKPDSFGLLQEIADTLREHPDILRVSIEGHTDSRGSASSNQKLSAARAASVRTWLVEHGIPETALTSVGYGEARPVDRHENEAAWEMNRRVEFMIVEWATP